MKNEFLPHNFSWIQPNVLAGSRLPQSEEHVNFLLQQGIRVIINLTDSLNYSSSLLMEEKFLLHRIEIEDFTAPSITQIREFQALIEKYRAQSFPVLVHCFAGCGRTGTMLAAFLIHKTPELDVDEIISNLRLKRPCSIETQSQEEVLYSYKNHLLLNRDR